MRKLFTIVIAVLMILSSGVWAAPVETGREKGGTGTDSTSTEAPNTTAGVQISRLTVTAAEINPDFYKVAHWDTLDINMYHVDMTNFHDTLNYVFHRPATGNTFTVPHQGRITSGFGRRKLYGRKFHKGLDIDLETGDEVGAAMNGKVRIARYSNGYGNFVVISHEGGLETLYGHMSQLWVTEGEEVQSGQIIGLGGSTGQSTGSHLHFEVRVFGEQVDPSWILDTKTLMPYQAEIKIDGSWFDHLRHVSDIPYHIVKEGETLEGICAMYEMEMDVLIMINDLGHLVDAEDIEAEVVEEESLVTVAVQEGSSEQPLEDDVEQNAEMTPVPVEGEASEAEATRHNADGEFALEVGLRLRLE